MDPNETVDLRCFETGIQQLMSKLPFPPAPNGQPMPDQQKMMMLVQLVTISIMN